MLLIITVLLFTKLVVIDHMLNLFGWSPPFSRLFRHGRYPTAPDLCIALRVIKDGLDRAHFFFHQLTSTMFRIREFLPCCYSSNKNYVLCKKYVSYEIIWSINYAKLMCSLLSLIIVSLLSRFTSKGFREYAQKAIYAMKGPSCCIISFITLQQPHHLVQLDPLARNVVSSLIKISTTPLKLHNRISSDRPAAATVEPVSHTVAVRP